MSETKWMIAREIPHLRRYALVLAGDPSAADDLVQDTLERAIRKRHLWTRRGSIRGWLFRILYHTFLNQAARRRRARAEVELEAAPVVAERPHHELGLVCRDIAAAMRALPDDQRAAIALTAIEGLSYDEAADVLSVPVGTLRSRLSRGRDRLRELYPMDQAAAAVGPVDPEAPRLRRVK